MKNMIYPREQDVALDQGELPRHNSTHDGFEWVFDHCYVSYHADGSAGLWPDGDPAIDQMLSTFRDDVYLTVVDWET